MRPDLAHIAIAKKHIFADIPAYAFFHTIKAIPFFLGSSLKEATTVFRSPNFSQNTSDLFIRGSGVIKKLWQELPFTLESMLRVLSTIFMFIGVLRAWKEKNGIALLLFAIILLFALMSSPWASPRFRLPFEPYILLLALYGLQYFFRALIPGMMNRFGTRPRA